MFAKITKAVTAFIENVVAFVKSVFAKTESASEEAEREQRQKREHDEKVVSHFIETRIAQRTITATEVVEAIEYHMTDAKDASITEALHIVFIFNKTGNLTDKDIFTRLPEASTEEIVQIQETVKALIVFIKKNLQDHLSNDALAVLAVMALDDDAYAETATAEEIISIWAK